MHGSLTFGSVAGQPPLHWAVYASAQYDAVVVHSTTTSPHGPEYRQAMGPMHGSVGLGCVAGHDAPGVAASCATQLPPPQSAVHPQAPWSQLHADAVHPAPGSQMNPAGHVAGLTALAQPGGGGPQTLASADASDASDTV